MRSEGDSPSRSVGGSLSPETEDTMASSCFIVFQKRSLLDEFYELVSRLEEFTGVQWHVAKFLPHLVAKELSAEQLQKLKALAVEHNGTYRPDIQNQLF
jgi:hypothetical protein